MSASAGIHILTDRKAKILTAIKASLHDAEKLAGNRGDKVASKDQISGDTFHEIYDECEKSFGESLFRNVAVVLYDDYISQLYEDCEPEYIEKQAQSYSEIFDKPVLYSVLLDNDAIIFGVALGGKIATRLVTGEYLDEYDLCDEKINMDYLSRIFNATNLSDLNDCDNVGDVLFALDEDYGICADVTPLSITLFDDKYKLLEESESFCVYSDIE